jgi:hypothetical protein
MAADCTCGGWLATLADGAKRLLLTGRALLRACVTVVCGCLVRARSFVWWDFERWQQEVDWMALHGVNLALVSPVISDPNAWVAV